MIRLPGLELLILMFYVTVGLTVAALVLVPTLITLARLKWSAHRPALAEHHVALGSVVWTTLWALLHLPDSSTLFALVPFAICVAGFWTIASGNRRRGHVNPGTLVPGIWALLLAVATLGITAFAHRLHLDAVEREHAERVAEGQRNQDWFQALELQNDGTIALVGTTSSPPNEADDVWLRVLDTEGQTLVSRTFVKPGDQSGLALAIGADGERVLGGKDEEHAFLAVATRDSLHVHRWDTTGVVGAIVPAGGGRYLVAGRSADSAWIALVDGSGREAWRRTPALDVSHPQVMALALAGERFVAAGSDHILAHGAFLVGGTLGGAVTWTRQFRAAPRGLCELTDLRPENDGTILALGSRSSPDGLEDLWLVHLAPDGTTLGESTFGDAPGERSGGLALRGDDVVVAGHRFTGLEPELWLRSMDLRGSVRWERTWPESAAGRASDVAILPGGDILLAGGRTRHSKRDAWIARFTRDGAPVWQRTFPVP